LTVALAQQTVPADLDSFVHRHSEGNPLFVLALVKHLIAQRLLIQKTSDSGHQWALSTPVDKLEPAVPEELAQMVELEVQSLAPRDQTLLEAASLFTVAFPAWGVAAALDEPAAAIEESFESLARRLIFICRAGHDELPSGTPSAFYVFAHGIYREVLYQRQALARRAERHNRVAQRLAALFAGREEHVAREMATHYEAAGNWLPAIRALQSAARFAIGRQSYSVVAELLQDGLRIARNLPAQDRTLIDVELGEELAMASHASTNHSCQD